VLKDEQSLRRKELVKKIGLETGVVSNWQFGDIRPLDLQKLGHATPRWLQQQPLDGLLP